MITLRKATMADAAFLLELRNDPTAFQHFFSPQQVELTDHLQWLEQSLMNPRRALFIIEASGQSIGQVRFDIEDKTAEIGINIAQAQRGKGYGVASIADSCHFLMQNNPAINVIVARVKDENEASLKAFYKAGFKKIGSQNNVTELRYTKN